MNSSSDISRVRPTRARSTGYLVATAALVAMAACTQMLSIDAVKTAISKGVNDKLGLTIASVTCPDSREIKAKDAFECVAAPQGGGRLTVKVTQDDDKGNVTWEVVKTEGLLDLASLETQIKSGIKEQLGTDVTVACGGKYRAAEPGKTFECTAAEAQGGKAQVVVTMKDAEGNISWSIGK